MAVEGQVSASDLRRRSGSARAARWSARDAVSHVGVLLCVLVAAAAAVVKLDDTLGVFDLRADSNDASTYYQRTYPTAHWVAGSGQVIEDARLWMPEDATYRVVFGSESAENGLLGWAPHFLNGFLLPRRQTESRAAPWVFCYGCDEATVARLEVLSEGEGRLVFGRLRS